MYPAQSDFRWPFPDSGWWYVQLGPLRRNVCASNAGEIISRAKRNFGITPDTTLANNNVPHAVWDSNFQQALISHVPSGSWIITQLRTDLAQRRISQTSMILAIYYAFYANSGPVNLGDITLPAGVALPVFDQQYSLGNLPGIVCFDAASSEASRVLETISDAQYQSVQQQSASGYSGPPPTISTKVFLLAAGAGALYLLFRKPT